MHVKKETNTDTSTPTKSQKEKKKKHEKMQRKLLPLHVRYDGMINHLGFILVGLFSYKIFYLIQMFLKKSECTLGQVFVFHQLDSFGTLSCGLYTES